MSVDDAAQLCSCHTVATNDMTENVERRADLASCLWELALPRIRQIRALCGYTWDPAADELIDLVDGDLLALTTRDPATHGSWREALGSYRSFHAVLAYRLAHHVLTTARHRGACNQHAYLLARRISEQAKVETGVELHPAARIGPRFVVDHGSGTVVGEGVVIGSDCYLLQCVVLGSLKIADNLPHRRHPTLGDRVEVGAYARILGPLTIGDDTIIGSHALVRDDVPPQSRVSVLNAYQVTAGRTDLAITGVEAVSQDRFRVYGEGLHDPALRVEPEFAAGDGELPVAIVGRGGDHLLLQVPGMAVNRRAPVRLNGRDGGSVGLVLPNVWPTEPGPASAPRTGTDQ
ncbi:hypothetical protein TPA0907_56980 [Micromonospora humidisoli]|uniref:serine O-acetyltransferase n=1 Tax=Micromonospora TaxID=1873 RepID=UPI001EF53F26|nr:MULTISPECIES: serine O-acetyltransferase [Micromonospora]GHJ11331.1 hypothetical protein TPA0907_56980 [Micromonospora sp. AKA109]